MELSCLAWVENDHAHGVAPCDHEATVFAACGDGNAWLDVEVDMGSAACGDKLLRQLHGDGNPGEEASMVVAAVVASYAVDGVHTITKVSLPWAIHLVVMGMVVADSRMNSPLVCH